LFATNFCIVTPACVLLAIRFNHRTHQGIHGLGRVYFLFTQDNQAMRSIILSLILLFTCGITAYCQVDHLNRSDSGRVLAYLSNYDRFIAQGDNKEASRMMNEIGYIYWNHNNPRTAISYYERSLKLNGNIDNENGIAMIHNNLGMLYNDIEDFNSALQHFKFTLDARRAGNEPVGIISSLINLSVICNNLKKYDESIAYLQEALSLSRQINDPQQMSSVYAMLSETFEKKGNVEESMKYFQLFKSFHDLLQKKEITKLSGDLEKDSLQKQVKELELQKKMLEIKEAHYELDSATSKNKTLLSNLSRNQLELEVVKNREKLQQEKIVIEETRNKALLERKNHVKDIFVVVSFFLVLVGAGLIFYNRKIYLKNQRLKQQNLDIERQKLELEHANEVKAKIFSVIAHDLRSPLNAVQSFFYIIEMYEVSPDLKKILGGLERDIRNMANVLDTLLNWAMTQLQEFKPQLKQVPLAEAVNENIALLKPLAQKKDITIQNNLPENLVAVTDIDMTKITVRNIVQNAVKYTKPGGVVQISGARENGHTFVTISDNGIGMGNDKIASLFNFKSNKSTAGTSNEKGTGLGMVLCAELVRLCNGEILINSELNKGTSITLKFNSHL